MNEARWIIPIVIVIIAIITGIIFSLSFDDQEYITSDIEPFEEQMEIPLQKDYTIEVYEENLMRERPPVLYCTDNSRYTYCIDIDKIYRSIDDEDMFVTLNLTCNWIDTWDCKESDEFIDRRYDFQLEIDSLSKTNSDFLCEEVPYNESIFGLIGQ